MYIFSILVSMQAAGAILFFPITWLFMRKEGGKPLQVGWWWLIGGLVATAIISGAVRYLAIFIYGVELAYYHPSQNANMFYSFGLPITVSIGICSFLKTRSKVN